MATTAHCAYCFECLSANLEKRKPLSLAAVEELWDRYTLNDEEEEAGEIPANESNTNGSAPYRSAAISRVIGASPSSSSSSAPSASSSTPSLNTNASSTTSQSSKSSKSLFSLSRLGRGHQRPSQPEEFPLFVTWDTRASEGGHKNLRGCIGTFEAQELDDGLRTYAITSALEDTRFRPVTQRELPTLECSVTLLTNFESISDPMDWQIGTHGLRISFVYNNRRHGSTYLPDVAREQGWTKDETMVSLMRKAGWNGRSEEWRKVSNLHVIRYKGSKTSLSYRQWLEWKKWAADTRGHDEEV